MDRTIPRVIPEDTSPSKLRQLFAAYANPNIPVPPRYRLLVLARITTLLAATAYRPDGVR